MPDLPRRPISRVLSDDDGLDLIGDSVEAAEPNITDAAVYVDEDTGVPTLVYAPFPGDFSTFRAAARAVPFTTTTLRGSGMRNVSRTFGFAPRNVVTKRESCRPAALSHEVPKTHAIIVGTALELDGWLAGEVPEIVDDGYDDSHAIDDEWRLAEGTYWTSGVVNLSSALPYHRDRNNFPVWSAMPVARRGTRGGALSIPEYGLTIECRDGWVVCFNGYRLTHGVTPIRPISSDGYRISVVYYCLRGLKDCHTDALEQAEAKRKRTERERRIADGHVPGGMMRTQYPKGQMKQGESLPGKRGK